MRGLSGHLDVVCALDSRGLSHLARQSFCAPIHLSKPHLDEGTLVVNVVNPTAGLLAGDRVKMQARVESGASLLLTTPSASRAHRMHDGFAEVSQHFSVASGAWLESWPELFIPQTGTRYRQRTQIDLERGGELLFFETLAPGRVASGEAFAYESLEWATDLTLDGKPIARERYRLSPGNGSLDPLRARFATAYYASCFVISSRLSADSACWSAIHAMHADGEAWVGVSALCDGGWVVKVLAPGSVVLREKLSAIRRELFATLGRKPPSLRRA